MGKQKLECLSDYASKSLRKKYKKSVTPIPYGIYIPEQESDTDINWKGLPKYCNIFKDSIKQRRMTAVQHQMSLELRIDAVKYKKA